MPRPSSASFPEDPAEALRSALDAGMRFLGPSARSCQEVRHHLRKGGCPPEVAQQAEARLLELGLLDDLALARAVIEDSVLVRHLAPARAEAALAARGVPSEVVARALGELRLDDGAGAGEAHVARALALATARLRVLHGPEPSVRRRLWGYLARRGYDAEVVEQVCARLFRGDLDEGAQSQEFPANHSAKAPDRSGSVR